MQKTVGLTLLFKHLSNHVVFGLIIILAILSGCAVDRPHVDLVLAREAFLSAQEVDAAKYSPANFHLAEEAYRKAMSDYKKRDYRNAILGFRTAKNYAERAENAARIQRQKSGEEGL